MNNKFDELAKGLALSVTRRQAFKRFGVGLAGMALACFGLADKAKAHSFKECVDRCVKACVAAGYSYPACEEGCTFSCGASV